MLIIKEFTFASCINLVQTGLSPKAERKMLEQSKVSFSTSTAVILPTSYSDSFFSFLLMSVPNQSISISSTGSSQGQSEGHAVSSKVL